MSTPGHGLRERKKLFTRHTIAEAAFDLALAKGLDRLTIEEVADKAFVSPRTVSNYFAGKEEAVVEVNERDVEAIYELFEQTPQDMAAPDALCSALIRYAEAQTPKQLRLLVRKAKLIEKYPSLRPFQTAQWDRLEAGLRERLVARLGTDAEDMYPWLAAGAAVSALKTATTIWVLRGAPKNELPTLLREACSRVGEMLAAAERR